MDTGFNIIKSRSFSWRDILLYGRVDVLTLHRNRNRVNERKGKVHYSAIQLLSIGWKRNNITLSIRLKHWSKSWIQRNKSTTTFNPKYWNCNLPIGRFNAASCFVLSYWRIIQVSKSINILLQITSMQLFHPFFFKISPTLLPIFVSLFIGLQIFNIEDKANVDTVQRLFQKYSPINQCYISVD